MKVAGELRVRSIIPATDAMFVVARSRELLVQGQFEGRIGTTALAVTVGFTEFCHGQTERLIEQ